MCAATVRSGFQVVVVEVVLVPHCHRNTSLLHLGQRWLHSSGLLHRLDNGRELVVDLFILLDFGEMNRFFLIAICILGVSSLGASCIWTSTHCACSKKTPLLGESNCYDLISDVPGSEKKKCSSRKCRESYVCDCAGTSYCEHESENRSALQHVGDGECIVVERNVTSLSLVDEDITNIHNTTPTKNRDCLFSDTECTCASTTEIGVIQDCVDFVYEDATKGPVCRVRDCKESMQCDCGGSSRCSRAERTTTAWRKVHNEGRPGFAICEEFESTTYHLTKVGDQPSEEDAIEAKRTDVPQKQEAVTESPRDKETDVTDQL